MIERILPSKTPYEGIPYPGCAATEPCGTDSYPCTVSWVSAQTTVHEGRVIPRRVKVLPDLCRGAKGHINSYTEDQRYVYYTTRERDDVDAGREYSWRPKFKRYVRVGCRAKDGPVVWFGYRHFYYDPCF